MKTMNRTFFAKSENNAQAWRVVDATGKIVGRLATELADMLRGRDKATFTPHSDAGDYVVVINADKVVFSGDKMREKEYQWYTGWIGGLKTLTAEQYMKKDPSFIITHAVKGMLPKNRLGRAMYKKLFVYEGAEHPHKAQTPKELKF